MLLVYQNNTSDVNITEMTTYIIVSTVIGIVLNNRIISEINDQIYTGKIGTELVKPYSYFSLMLARTIGEMLFQLTFFRSVAAGCDVCSFSLFHSGFEKLFIVFLLFCSRRISADSNLFFPGNTGLLVQSGLGIGAVIK